MPVVYIGMTVDILHHGHINIIANAKEYGEITIGLLTDRAIDDHKRLPFRSWEQRKKIVENISGVTRVVPQDDWDYSPNLLKYKPDFMVHGTDWIQGPLAPYREKAISALQQYGGELIEIPYTEGVSSSAISKDLQSIGTTPDVRRATLRRLLSAKPLLRFIEAHNPISGLIAEHACIESGDTRKEYDGFWSSSLTDSTERGKPDIEALSINRRLDNISDIFDVTTKPLIIDADTGGLTEHLELNIRTMERLGISAAIIEDKTGLKKNSLLGNDVSQSQEDIDTFCHKISAARAARVSEDFMVIARIESLILEKGLSDAISRAQAYARAGADGVMIHSRRKEPTEIFEFSYKFREMYPDLPLISVPTSYNGVYENELERAGFNVVIYANHLLRAAYPAMYKTALTILEHERSLEIEDELMSIKEILQLIPGTR